MEENPESREIESVQKRTEKYMNACKIDPRSAEASQYLQNNEHAILDIVNKSTNFWKEGLNQDMAFLEFTMDGFTIEANLVDVNRTDLSPLLMIDIYDSEWLKLQIEKKKKIFPNNFIPASQFAANLNIHEPLSDFGIKNEEFDPTKIRDDLGKGIDANIMEFIRQINVLGIESSGSCGGHNNNQLPYIDFPGDKLEEVAKLALLLKRVTNQEWFISPHGHMTTIRLSPPPDISLRKSQKQLDQLTDFISHKLKNIPISPGERCFRLTRGFYNRLSSLF